jgi:hypothetical protein
LHWLPANGIDGEPALLPLNANGRVDPTDEAAQPSTERKAFMKSKRQTTRAKLERERLVQERRALKREKKNAAAAAARDAQAAEQASGSPDTAE